MPTINLTPASTYLPDQSLSGLPTPDYAAQLRDLNVKLADISAENYHLRKIVQQLTEAVATADPKTEVAQLHEALKALTMATNLRIDALEAQMATLDRRLATFSEAERYAITRAMVTRILAEEQPA
jgi:Iap family predicted aminopeptidase